MIDCPRCGRETLKAVFADADPSIADEPLYYQCIRCLHKTDQPQ